MILAAVLAGCGAMSRRGEAPVDGGTGRTAPPATASGSPSAPRGGFYKDDGPGDNPPADLAGIPDAEPRAEPLHRFANRPYQVLGREYVPMTRQTEFRERGTASWYGRRFHGQRTSTGEVYDMYAMTAAHPTLPIPSYARVTNLTNGRSVIVRVNDRGPFHGGRIVDLSYTAAWKLGYANVGSASVEVEALLPGAEIAARVPSASPAASGFPPRPQEAAPAQLPVVDSRAASGLFVQLGAFSARDNAEALRTRIARELDWLGDAIRVVATDNLFRLHAGPYRNRDEAQSIADRIRAALNLVPLVVQR